MRTTDERFWEKVDHATEKPDGCWLWLAGKDRRGYGMFKMDAGRAIGAHRAAWELTFGAVPDGKQVMHHCDTPTCVNPEHLFIGTQADNNRDRELKRRGRGPHTGSLRRLKGDAWEARVSLGRDPATGRRRTISRVFHGTKREAQLALATLVAEVGGGAHRSTVMTVGELLERYLDHLKRDLSPSTLLHYRRRVKAQIIPALGSVKLPRLTAAHLDAYYGARLDSGHSPSDVRQDHAIVRGALKQAVKWDLVADNVALKASPPRLQHQEIRPPTPTVMLSIIDAAERGTGHPNSPGNPDLACFLRLLTACGARRGEVCALQLGDLDLLAGTVTIARNVVETDNGLVVKEPKTHNGVRRVNLDDATITALRHHVARAHANATKAGVTLDGRSFLFSPDLGEKPWRPNYATLAFVRLTKALGVKCRLHDLRHAQATYLLAGGMPVRDVAGRLGQDPATTMRTYAAWLEQGDKTASQLMGRLLTAGVDSAAAPGTTASALPAG